MNVPQLRFSGFDGEWENFEFKKLVKLEGGATPLKSEKRYWQNGHIPWVSSQEVGTKKLDKTTFNITEAAVSETSTKMVDKDTLLIVVRSGILVRKIPLSITAVPMAINQDIKALIIKDKKLHHLFLYQWMKKNEKAMLSNVVKGGTTVQSVNTPDLQDYLIGIPSINEQYKIVSFFELIDKKIEVLQEKIEKLEQLKKGMMQKIFSQELRFKDEDGGEFPDWETLKLEEFTVILKGNSLSKSSIAKDGENQCILYGELFTKYGPVAKEIISRTNDISSVKSKYGDILMPTSDVTPYGLAKACCVLRDGVLIGGDINIIRINKDSDPIFMSYQINFFKERIMKLVSGTTIKHIYAKDLKELEYYYPSLKEQKKISSMLMDVDMKIDKEKEKLMVLEEQKRGFMQGMFI